MANSTKCNCICTVRVPYVTPGGKVWARLDCHRNQFLFAHILRLHLCSYVCVLCLYARGAIGVDPHNEVGGLD